MMAVYTTRNNTQLLPQPRVAEFDGMGLKSTSYWYRQLRIIGSTKCRRGGLADRQSHQPRLIRHDHENHRDACVCDFI